MSMKKRWFRIGIAGLLPIAVSFWLSIPAFQPKPQFIQGPASHTTACLIKCAEVLSVQGVLIGCKVDLLGVIYTCAEKILQPGEAQVTYAKLPSLASLLGFARTSGTLVELKRDGQLIYSRSVSSQVWSAIYGGWVFNAVYWPLVALIVWLWPESYAARKLKRKPRDRE
jgi:hypothetical protein